MSFNQYHEPPQKPRDENKTLARMFASLTEEAKAINWYQQHQSVEKNKDDKAIMENMQGEEFKHFKLDLEFLLRELP